MSRRFEGWRSRLGLALALAAALSLGGCGKKPKFVDPPQGKGDDHFPRSYPNPVYDPKPVGAKPQEAKPPAAAPTPAPTPTPAQTRPPAPEAFPELLTPDQLLLQSPVYSR